MREHDRKAERLQSLHPELSKRQRAALLEMATYPGKHYWFRRVTCQELAKLELAAPMGENLKRPAYRLTEKARKIIEEIG